MNNLFFIVNPQAKNGFGMKTWQTVEAVLVERQISYQVLFTEHSGHAKELARKIGRNSSNEETVVIAVGGDGTLHEVINGLIKYPTIKVGLIPAGSGNDFCRGFLVPSDPIHALNLIMGLNNRFSKAVDIGMMTNASSEEIYFVNNMGAGFDALVAEGANQSRLKALFNRISLGKLVYVAILLKKLITFRSTSVEINVDGSVSNFEKVWFVTVSNQPYFGGGMKIAPDASPFDGELNITVVHNLSKLKLLAVFISVFWGRHTKFKEVKTLTGKSLKIDSSEPLLVHLDGEIYGHTPVTVKVVEKALPMLIGSDY